MKRKNNVCECVRVDFALDFHSLILHRQRGTKAKPYQQRFLSLTFLSRLNSIPLSYHSPNATSPKRGV
jgi:hypothetical protein